MLRLKDVFVFMGFDLANIYFIKMPTRKSPFEISAHEIRNKTKSWYKYIIDYLEYVYNIVPI